MATARSIGRSADRRKYGYKYGYTHLKSNPPLGNGASREAAIHRRVWCSSFKVGQNGLPPSPRGHLSPRQPEPCSCRGTAAY